MKTEDWLKLPKEVQDFIWDNFTDINDELVNKYGFNFDQIDYINSLEDKIILKIVSPLDLPKQLEYLPGAKNFNIRELALDLAIKAFSPLQFYIDNIDRLILRLGGKVPHVKPLKSEDNLVNSNVFPGHTVGTVKEMMSKYEDFKDLKLSSKKIVNEKGFLTAPTVDSWLKDYIHFAGASSRDSLSRAQYLSKAPNVMELNKDESESLRYFLVSYDDDAPMTFDYSDSILKISQAEKKKIGKKNADKPLDSTIAINEIERHIKELLENILPEDILMSEAENDVNKIRDILWQAIGIQDKDKVISCIGLMIKKRILDQTISEDSRFKNILKRFVGVKYGHSLEQAIGDETDKLMLRRLFLEMILSDKFRIPEDEMLIIAFYLSNIVSSSGQLVYFDKAYNKLRWREVQVLGNKFSWVYPIN
ncbi:hypothetical protein KKH39_02270 [Patescibacteria group bacterium]|nr:hypothetical protein [Patescibacteria group bacterium]